MKTERVVLVHGIASPLWLMAWLSRRLQAADFETILWGYPSLRGSIVAHAERLRTAWKEWEEQDSAIHLVAHSMGCIVVRAALEKGSLPKLGKVVFLAPPNRGSPWGRIFASTLGRMIPAIAELSDDSGSYVNQLAVPSPSMGILAAKYDWIVPRSSTMAHPSQGYELIKTFHSGLLFDREAAQRVVAFLKGGSFSTL